MNELLLTGRQWSKDIITLKVFSFSCAILKHAKRCFLIHTHVPFLSSSTDLSAQQNSFPCQPSERFSLPKIFVFPMVVFAEKTAKNGFVILSYFCENVNDFRSIQLLRNRLVVMIIMNIY